MNVILQISNNDNGKRNGCWQLVGGLATKSLYINKDLRDGFDCNEIIVDIGKELDYFEFTELFADNIVKLREIFRKFDNKGFKVKESI